MARKQIETYVAELFKEKQASTDRSVDKYKQKATADLQKDMQRLLQMYKEKSKSNQDKINQGMQGESSASAFAQVRIELI